MRYFLIFLTTALISGCAMTRNLDVTAQERSSKQIAFGKFTLKGYMGGDANGEIAGEKFKGTWSASVPGAHGTSNNYGNAYANVGGTPVYAGYGGQTQTSVRSNQAQVSLMMVGDKGTSLSCQFVAAASLVINSGQGVCEDSRHLVYDFHY